MSEQNPTPGERVDDILASVDTEMIGQKARSLKDRATLFVQDHKLELMYAGVFIGGVWVGRRQLNGKIRKAIAALPHEYLELAVTKPQVEKLLENRGKLELIFDTVDGPFVLKAAKKV